MPADRPVPDAEHAAPPTAVPRKPLPSCATWPTAGEGERVGGPAMVTVMLPLHACRGCAAWWGEDNVAARVQRISVPGLLQLLARAEEAERGRLPACRLPSEQGPGIAGTGFARAWRVWPTGTEPDAPAAAAGGTRLRRRRRR